MNREIKFRVWDTTRGYFIKTTDGIDDDLCLGIDGDLYKVYSCYAGGGINIINSDNYVIQQYTGLKDKKGKEIFEGDIIRGQDDDGNINKNYKNTWVEFQKGCFANHYWGHCLYDSELEVIGNIYQNPELLEAKHD